MRLFACIREASWSDIDACVRHICAFIVKRGDPGVEDHKEIFGSIGLQRWWYPKDVKKATVEFLEKEGSEGRVLQGGVEWFKGFLEFVDGVRQTPVQRLLSMYGRYVRDPLSPEGSREVMEAIKSVYEKQSLARRVDPKIHRLAEAYGLVGSEAK